MRQLDINPLEIDFNDETYRFTNEKIRPVLLESIRVIGITHPVRLEELPAGGYRIISGSQRVRIALKLGLSEIPVIIYKLNECTELEFFLMNFHENSATRHFAPDEISAALVKLIYQFELPKREVVRIYLPLLHLGPNPKVMESYLKFDELENEIQQAVSDDFIGIDMAIRLLDYAKDDRLAFFDLARRLNLGKNRQRELLNLLIDIVKRDELSFAKIIGSDAIRTIINDDSVTVPQQAERVRSHLKMLRYPRFSAVEERFNALVKRMKLPRGVSIMPFPFFEQSKYTLTVEFSTQVDFQQKEKILRALADGEILRELDEL